MNQLYKSTYSILFISNTYIIWNFRTEWCDRNFTVQNYTVNNNQICLEPQIVVYFYLPHIGKYSTFLRVEFSARQAVVSPIYRCVRFDAPLTQYLQSAEFSTTQFYALKQRETAFRSPFLNV